MEKKRALSVDHLPSHSCFSTPFSLPRAAVCWAARASISMSKPKHPKAVEALDLQAKTKFYVYKLSHIGFQAPEINYFTIWVL